jgi:PAS domain S-box-containing protein
LRASLLSSVADGKALTRAERLLWGTGVAAAYVCAGKLGIGLSVAHGVITPVWAPSGIAVAALLVFGRSLWPAIFVAAFLTNVTSGASPLVAAGIACGNALEGITACALLTRARFRIGLARVRDVLLLVGLGAGVSTLVAATNGIAVLTLASDDHGSLRSDWLLWWFGDAAGVLIVTPFLLLAYVHRRQRPSRRRLLEAYVLTAALTLTSALAFLEGGWRYSYLIVPLLLWAVLRFHQSGAAGSAFLVGAIATWATVVGDVPIEASNPTTRVQVTQALVGLLAVSLLMIGATLEEREAAKRAAEKTAALLSEAQALTHIASWEFDFDTGRGTWSDELYRIFGISESAEISPRRFLARVHPEDRSRLKEVGRRAFRDRRPFSIEYRILSTNGGHRILHTRGRVVLDATGRPQRLVGTAQDVTEQRQAEILRADILSVVSHELRTPLGSILNFALALSNRGAPLSEETATQMIGQVGRQAQRIDRLLADLLEIDRLRHGLVAPEREPTEVLELVSQTVEGHRAGDRTIAVEGEPTRASLDAPKVARMLDNLVGNALKHTPPDTPVIVRVEREETDLLLVVDDEGPGIPDEYKTAVFELFDRGAKATSHESGTGIGLALVARLAALHGGYAWAEDAPGGGASVRVVLPDCVLAGHPRPVLSHA